MSCRESEAFTSEGVLEHPFYPCQGKDEGSLLGSLPVFIFNSVLSLIQ